MIPSYRQCRLGMISKWVIMVFFAMSNMSAVLMVVAQTTSAAPSPSAAEEIGSPTTSPIPPKQTLTPFAPITFSPLVSPAPMASAAPTASPTILVPTSSPTNSPSYKPSSSKLPSYAPSFAPTNYPTLTHQPTHAPSFTTEPSSTPTSSSPTVSPTPIPTYAPVPFPSSMPSFGNETSVIRNCEQILEVETSDIFSDIQVGIYQLLMASYTDKFGYEIGPPQIVTESLVIGQDQAGGRRRRKNGGGGNWFKRTIRKILQVGGTDNKRGGTTSQDDTYRALQTAPTKNLLVISFTMEYSSRYGLDIEDYPSQFQNWVNSNLEQVTIDMKDRFLPVIAAQNVIVYKPTGPTGQPTSETPSAAPTLLSMPTSVPSYAPSQFPSWNPSRKPSTLPPNSGKDNDQTSFIVGLAAGLGGAAIIICFLLWNMRRKNQKKQEERRAAMARADEGQAADMEAQISNLDEGMEVPMSDDMLSGGGGGISRQSSQDSQQRRESRDISSPQGAGTVVDSIFTNPSMVSGGGSFSSDPDNYAEGSGVQLNSLQDEFDNYKNQDLEYMRNGVEESVYGAEGMMSLAMTRALMDDEDVDIHPSWGGAEDPESIEANGLCETNDWLRKNEHSTLDERNLFFQELLNRMVITVRRGMISPSDGTRAIHCCAAMLGLQLEKDLPNSVLLVHGMRKTNDLTLGRSYLVEAFKSFGDIEGAAIAPSNRGFGFVRFVSPKSVQRALERFRISEIEVQDVSVMIKSLKSDAPAP